MSNNVNYAKAYLDAGADAAEVATLWQHVRNGSHVEQPAPTLRDILYPPVYPATSQLSPNTELNRILVEVTNEVRNAQEATELPGDLTPPTPTIPRSIYPDNHPGQGWVFNHAKSKRFYPLSVMSHGKKVRAQYIRYHRFEPFPRIEGTMGRDRMIFETDLRAPDINRGLPIMTLPQQRIFDPDLVAATDVNRALQQIDDWPLQAEVQFYRSTTLMLDNYHEQVNTLRQQIATATEDIKKSVWRLSQGNVYRRVQNVLNREGDHALWVSNRELRSQMHRASQTPENADVLCKWCQTATHDTLNCWLFLRCYYCGKYGHEGVACYNPHQGCDSDCHVPSSHPKYQRPCPARPAPSETSSDGERRRYRRREERLRRREEWRDHQQLQQVINAREEGEVEEALGR